MTDARALLPVLALALVAGACTPTASTSTASSTALAAAPGAGVTAPGFNLPEGGGCAGEIARTRAVLANDLATGHVTRAVHDRFAAELDRASGACAGGRGAEAERLVRATKARFGYT